MSLIDLKTDLTSLKYSEAPLYGNSSTEPYIQTPIPSLDKIGKTGGKDNLIRGGTLVPKRSLLDVERIGKWFSSPLTNGIVFTAKQNLLARQQAKIPYGWEPKRVWTPASTLLEVAGVATGLHVDGKGINPFQSIRNPKRLYENAVFLYDQNGINRLNLLRNSKIVGYPKVDLGYGVSTIDISKMSEEHYESYGAASLFGIDPYTDLNLFKFPGGPNATIPGLTNSIYKRVVNTTYAEQLTNAGEYTNPKGKTVSDSTFSTLDYNLLDTTYNKLTEEGPGKIIDFRYVIRKKIGNSLYLDPSVVDAFSPAAASLQSTDYDKWNRQTYGLGDPGKPGLDRTNPDEGVRTIMPGKGATGEGPLNQQTIDKITYEPLYISLDGKTDKNVANTDIIPFYITVLDNNLNNENVHIHFRAFIDNFSDDYGASWNGSKFLGRGEEFFTYDGFSRTISLGFKVHAQSKQELRVMYSKLNYLASTLAPDYDFDTGTGGYMRGNLIKLTVGDYLIDQPGFITGLNYAISEETTWDIGRNSTGKKDSLALPHIIDVATFSFTPIHNFIPRKVSDDYVKNPTSENLDAWFIGKKENYGLVKKGVKSLIPHAEPVLKDKQDKEKTFSPEEISQAEEWIAEKVEVRVDKTKKFLGKFMENLTGIKFN
tara:strand:+ start:378 stop:2336 length:1959 start_codon:yes stop_codon:yes gene_type:complete